ncbi:Methyltransferase domain-containing protein [Halovenus aranensis]|jgi:SAM-dependent methyltransferase|uniref:Methyltransferase domain-containing protein n=1 Tax=Halovenus aranensis TaxID=890420 RepID=A0A1G8TF98_9EURY|nr:methyltransferase domain-containing protein [Halovenus aranensis]SDJ40077.1 Methyltransferase domain-containing protein [Halovenus aranensis]
MSESRDTHIWSTRQYPSLASNLLPATARLVSTAGIGPDDRVLDVGCGTGNVALTARRRGADVVGLDASQPMLELAGRNAGLAAYDDIHWTEGDAESLPFDDDRFDAAMSNFGHVFAPAADEAAAEMCRVTRQGGQIAFTAWSPNGLVGALTDILTDHATYPDHDPRGHLRWGTPQFVREILGDRCELSFQRRVLRFRYVSPQHFWQEFAEEAGPLSPALQRLDQEQSRERLRHDALDCLQEWFADNTVRVEYLLVDGVVR